MKQRIAALLLALLMLPVLNARAAAAPDVMPGAWYEAAVTTVSGGVLPRGGEALR